MGGCSEPPCSGTPCGILPVIDYLFHTQLCQSSLLDEDRMTLLGLCPKTCGGCGTSHGARWMDIVPDPSEDSRFGVLCTGPPKIGCGESSWGSTQNAIDAYGRSGGEQVYWFQANGLQVNPIFDLCGSGFDTHLSI